MLNTVLLKQWGTPPQVGMVRCQGAGASGRGPTARLGGIQILTSSNAVHILLWYTKILTWVSLKSTDIFLPLPVKMSGENNSYKYNFNLESNKLHVTTGPPQLHRNSDVTSAQ